MRWIHLLNHHRKDSPRFVEKKNIEKRWEDPKMEVWVQGWPVPAMNGVITPISRVITPVTHCPITPSIPRKGPRCEMILESTKFQEEFPQNFHAEKNWHQPL